MSTPPSPWADSLRPRFRYFLSPSGVGASLCVCASAAAADLVCCRIGVQVYRRSDSWKPKNKFTLGTFGLTAPPKNIWEGH